MMITKTAIAIIALALPASAAVSNVEVLFDNFSGSHAGSFGVSNSNGSGQAFSTTSTGFILSEVALRIWNLNGTTGEFQVQVWNALGPSGSPGTQVGASIHVGLAENLTGLLTIPNLSVPLLANTTYFLAVTGTALTDVDLGMGELYPGQLYWDVTDVNTTASYDFNDSFRSGPYSQNLYMQVKAVPEPASLLLSILACGVMMARRKR